jgi:hypothetical protein
LDPVPERKQRERITLLDRTFAIHLHQALFDSSTGKQLFKTDWVDVEEKTHDFEELEKPSEGRISPFDYPPFNDEVDALLWLEEFTIFCVWSSSYSSAFLGTESRPSMAAVACDVVTFVNELNPEHYNRYMMTESSPLLQRLRQIPYGPGLFSIPRTPSNALRDVEIANKGFLLDLFSLAAAKHPSEEGWDMKQSQSIEANATSSIIHRTIVDLAERTQYPGPDTLNLGQMPYHDFMLPTLAGSLEDMKASLIVGPKFKLILTTDPSEHLTMSAAGEIKLFWEGPCEVSDFPGRKTFMRYRYHSLGKFTPC